MPVRATDSPILKWPDADQVREAFQAWAARLRARPEVAAVGWFGSYARGDWGVGSDLDVVVVVRESDEPFVRRAAGFDTGELPVPVDLLVYTREEWQGLAQEGGRLTREVRWGGGEGAVPTDGGPGEKGDGGCRTGQETG